jgi:hypothetical protein
MTNTTTQEKVKTLFILSTVSQTNRVVGPNYSEPAMLIELSHHSTLQGAVKSIKRYDTGQWGYRYQTDPVMVFKLHNDGLARAVHWTEIDGEVVEDPR